MKFVAHWDEVPLQRLDVGALHASWQDLGRAAGSSGASVKRELIDPGARPTPVHSHGRDEEFFFVLSGSGLSWQDGLTHEVSAGDFILHRPGEAAHTLIAGDEGLEVLVFGSEVPTEATHLPRAGVFWLGSWWTVSPGPPRPFEREPVELTGEPGPRPSTTVHVDEVPQEAEEHGDHLILERDVGRATGSTTSGIGHVEIPAGKRGWPAHCHSSEEEIFVVLGGEGFVRIGDDEHPVRRGSVVGRPPATRVPHTIRAAESSSIEYLAWGTRENNDIVFYPDSNKVALRGVGVRGRIEQLEYWDGEP